MKKLSQNEEKDKSQRSTWLLEPERTRETVLTYVVIFILVIAITLILV